MACSHWIIPMFCSVANGGISSSSALPERFHCFGVDLKHYKNWQGRLDLPPAIWKQLDGSHGGFNPRGILSKMGILTIPTWQIIEGWWLLKWSLCRHLSILIFFAKESQSASAATQKSPAESIDILVDFSLLPQERFQWLYLQCFQLWLAFVKEKQEASHGPAAQMLEVHFRFDVGVMFGWNADCTFTKSCRKLYADWDATNRPTRSHKSHLLNTFKRVPGKAEYKTELERLRVELERLSPNLKAVDQLQGVAEHVQAWDIWGLRLLLHYHEFLSWVPQCWIPQTIKQLIRFCKSLIMPC